MFGSAKTPILGMWFLLSTVVTVILCKAAGATSGVRREIKGLLQELKVSEPVLVSWRSGSDGFLR